MADELQRHRIEVTCPECGHVQAEPAMVISTQCRECRCNFKVEAGRGIVRPQQVTRIAAPKLAPPAESISEVKSYPGPSIRRGPVIQPPQSFFKRLLNPTKPPRALTCFNCEYSYTTAGEAQSSQCPKCSSYISLVDHEINESWHRQIQTCGDVIIQKAGIFSGATMRCRHLTVLGELLAAVHCSGDLIIRSSGKITGEVFCQTLRVEKGAHVEFVHPVNATSAFIDGHVRGQIMCTGTVTLEKRSELQGLVRTSSLIVKPGAKHSGTIDMVPANKF